MLDRLGQRFVELLWFGRQSSIVAQVLVATVPIIVTLLIRRELVFFSGYTTQQLTLLTVAIVTATIILNFWLLSKAGSSTYSPLLHSPNYIFKSTLLNLFTAGIAVYAGYLILLYPDTQLLIPSRNGILAGASLSAIYSVLLAGANAAATLSRTQRREKERVISTFLSECDKLESSATGAIEADTGAINDAVHTLRNKLSDEPMHDSSKIEAEIKEWHTSFQQYNTGGKRKMVGAGAATPSDMSDTWRPLYEQYQLVRKQLSDMETSGFNSVING